MTRSWTKQMQATFQELILEAYAKEESNIMENKPKTVLQVDSSADLKGMKLESS